MRVAGSPRSIQTGKNVQEAILAGVTRVESPMFGAKVG